MPQIISSRIKPAIATVVVLLVAALGLAACGGSSKGSSTSASVAAAGTTTSGSSSTQSGSTPTAGATSTNSGSTSATVGSAATPSGSTSTNGGPARGRAGRFPVVRECLQKNGITLPKPTPGQPGSGFLGGTPTLPKGVTRAQYQAALKKCGGGFTGIPRFKIPGFKIPAFSKELANFAACMRANGVNVPPPNASGKGPIFSTKGLNPTSAKFKAAEAKCSAQLRGLLLGRGPSTGGPPAGAPPGSGG